MVRWCDLFRDTCFRISLRTLQRVIHRDVAARNCLIQGSAPPTLKIADFGLAKVLMKSDLKISTLETETTSGSYAVYHVHKSGLPLPIRWMAPETILHMDFYIKVCSHV
jgi:serine/threonine protein kinase